MANKFLHFALSLRQKYPKFDIVIKEDSKLMKFLYKACLMKYWDPSFMHYTVTTIGYKVYMPKYLIGSSTGYAVLRHEAIHIAQWEKWKLWLWFTYLFCLPFFWTARAYWEFKAYVETMKVEFEETGYVRYETVEWIADLFVGPKYVYMHTSRGKIAKKLNKHRLLIMSSN